MQIDARTHKAVEAMKQGDYSLAEELLAEASEMARERVQKQEEAHAIFHGRTLRYVTVERRRGRKGRSVCADCYYGREWSGR
jgi:hypothetical protein